jgi:hypothetical protein
MAMNSDTQGVGRLPAILAQHLVTFSCDDSSPKVLEANGGRRLKRTYSGFIVEVHGHWCICTAAHCIEQVQELLEQGHVLTDWEIDDSAIQAPPERMPYRFSPDFYNDTFMVRDEHFGFDYGLILLDTFPRVALAKNGIRPINSGDLVDPFQHDASYWIVCGVPEESIKTFGSGLTVKEFTGILVRPLPGAPDWWIDPPALPRLYGEVCDPADPSDMLKSVQGMSGGPVFAVQEKDGIFFDPKLIGIQSSWVHRHRVIAACPAAPFFDALARMLADYEAAHPSGEDHGGADVRAS